MTAEARTDVYEVPTSAGSMWEGRCTAHGVVVIPVFDRFESVGFAGVHEARVHGKRLVDTHVYAADGTVLE